MSPSADHRDHFVALILHIPPASSYLNLHGIPVHRRRSGEWEMVSRFKQLDTGDVTVTVVGTWTSYPPSVCKPYLTFAGIS